MRGTAERAKVTSGGEGAGDLVFDLGDVKLRIACGVGTGVLESGEESLEFEVDVMEVWGR